MINHSQWHEWEDLKDMKLPDPPPDFFGLVPDNPLKGMWVRNSNGWYRCDDTNQDPVVWVEVTDQAEIERLEIVHVKNRISWNQIYHPFESARDAWLAD